MPEPERKAEGASADPGRVEHLEYASRDPVATRKFLEKVFRWRFTALDEGAYALHGEREGADGTTVGIRGLRGEEPPCSVGFVTVADLDAALRAAEGAGGRILVPKTEVPGLGWSAICLAPGEVVQGIFQPK